MRAMKFACWMMLMMLLSMTALAQNVATADLRGTIKDPNGALVTNATVTMHDEAKNIDRSVQTNEQGEYLFSQLPPGNYTMSVQAANFSKSIFKGVRLTVGQAAELPVTMKIATANSEITVNTDTELVETQQTSASTTITQLRIENLPTNGRNYINNVLTNSQTARR